MNNNRKGKKMCAVCHRMFDKDELVRGRFTFICPECKEKEVRHQEQVHTEFGVIP